MSTQDWRTAQRQQPVVGDLGLVLRIEAGLADRLRPVEIDRRIADRRRVVGIEDIEVGTCAIAVLPIDREAVVVEADEQLVFDLAEALLIFGLVVDAENGRRFVDRESRARHGAVVDHAAVVELPVVGVLMRVAQVLPDRPVLIELMAELITDRAVVGVEAVEVGRAGEEAARQLAVFGRIVLASHWQECVRRQPVPLVVGEDCERGLRVGLPCQRRRDEDAVVARIVRLGRAVAHEAGQTIGPDAGIVDRPADIEPGLDRVEAAIAEEAVIDRLVRRPLRDGIDHAAGLVLAIEDRGGALQHLDALQPVGLDLEAGEVDHLLRQPVTIDHRRADIEAADQALVEAVVDAPWRGRHAGKIGQRVLELRRLTVVQLLAGND